MEYKKGMLQGRLTNSYQSDHGALVHAVTKRKIKRPPCPYNEWGKKEIPNDKYITDVAFCGAKPGRKSVGWAWESKLNVTCKKCLNKINDCHVIMAIKHP